MEASLHLNISLKMTKAFCLFVCFPLAVLYVGSQFPDQRSNPYPLQWKYRIPATGLLGKSQQKLNGEKSIFTCHLSNVLRALCCPMSSSVLPHKMNSLHIFCDYRIFFKPTVIIFSGNKCKRGQRKGKETSQRRGIRACFGGRLGVVQVGTCWQGKAGRWQGKKQQVQSCKS